MKTKGHGAKQAHVEDHSLPGTNQAGKGPGPEDNKRKGKPSGGGTQDRLEEHSLPGTNQAGKGPGSDEHAPERAAGRGRSARRP